MTARLSEAGRPPFGRSAAQLNLQPGTTQRRLQLGDTPLCIPFDLRLHGVRPGIFSVYGVLLPPTDDAAS